jgi:signal transduction histidine kinase
MQQEELALILAPRGRDAAVVAQVVEQVHIGARICVDLAELMRELSAGAGCALIAEEALTPEGIAVVSGWLSQQPAWSDFPFIVLSSTDRARARRNSAGALDPLGNLLILERPLHAETLCHAVLSSLRGRRRQYVARAQLIERLEAERNLRLALKAGRLGAWRIRLSDMKLFASDDCKADFGRQPHESFAYDELIGAVHDQARASLEAAVELARGESTDFDCACLISWPDGSAHWIEMRGRAVLDEQGNVESIAGVTQDVTERRLAEQALQTSRGELHDLNESLERRILERTHELARANDRLTTEVAERERSQSALVQLQKMEAVGQLTGGIAHDFNNLLNSIVGNVDLIRIKAKDEQVLRYAENAKRAVARGAKLTAQLLAFARGQNLDLRPTNVPALIEGMSDLMTTALGSRVPMRTQFDPDLPPAKADQNQLELAILNLVINARDAMPQGGSLEVRAEARTAEGGDLLPGRYVVITVRDSGTGIPPELITKVFDPFFTTKPVGKGTGLGLSQVYGIARQSGGIARILSERNRGTSVEIWLPSAAAESVAASNNRADTSGSAPAAKVLVIDDDADVRALIVESLQVLGYDVLQAESGQIGLDLLRAEVPDLLMVDFAMPGMNGAEVIVEARKDFPALPVVMATGYAELPMPSGAIGAHRVLQKPFSLQQLGAIVADSLMAPPAA